jgi:uncharacterized membrane protein YdjX (TVP38/TMEM64 family)
MIVRAVLPRLLPGLAILIGALSLALNRYQLDPAVIEGAIHNLGVWGPVVHVALFALGTVLFVPGALLGLVGGVRTLAYTYLGYAGREASSGGESLIRKALVALSLLAAAAFLPRLVRQLRAGEQPEAARVWRRSRSCRTVS